MEDDDRFVDATEMVELLEELYREDRQQDAADAAGMSRGHLGKLWSAVRDGERVRVRRSTIPGLRRAIELRVGGREEYRRALNLAISKMKELVSELEAMAGDELAEEEAGLAKKAARAFSAVDERRSGRG